MYYLINRGTNIISGHSTDRSDNMIHFSVKKEVIDAMCEPCEEPYGYKFENGKLGEFVEAESNPRLLDTTKYTKFRERESKISSLVVTIASGKSFDADEKSQSRMLLALQTAQITGQKTTRWKMADNAIQEITLEELKEALSLAANKMSEIFVGASNGDQ